MNAYDYATVTGRLLLGGYFAVTAVLILVTPGSITDHIDRMRAYGGPSPQIAVWFGVAMQFIGASLIISGVCVEIGAFCLIAFTVSATAVYHRFWQETEPMKKRISRLFFMSNAAIVGGLLLVAASAAPRA